MQTWGMTFASSRFSAFRVHEGKNISIKIKIISQALGVFVRFQLSVLPVCRIWSALLPHGWVVLFFLFCFLNVDLGAKRVHASADQKTCKSPDMAVRGRALFQHSSQHPYHRPHRFFSWPWDPELNSNRLRFFPPQSRADLSRCFLSSAFGDQKCIENPSHGSWHDLKL